MSNLIYISEKNPGKIREKPMAYLVGTNAQVEIHVLSEAKPERRVQLRYSGTTYVPVQPGYAKSAYLPVTCVAEGPDLDAAALKMLEALGAVDAG